MVPPSLDYRGGSGFCILSILYPLWFFHDWNNVFQVMFTKSTALKYLIITLHALSISKKHKPFLSVGDKYTKLAPLGNCAPFLKTGFLFISKHQKCAFREQEFLLPLFLWSRFSCSKWRTVNYFFLFASDPNIELVLHKENRKGGLKFKIKILTRKKSVRKTDTFWSTPLDGTYHLINAHFAR